MSARKELLAVAGCFSLLSVCLSTWLIRQHQTNMTNFPVQSKIVGIIWMIPIYAIDSYLSLLFPTFALYIDMLRDCYEVRDDATKFVIKCDDFEGNICNRDRQRNNTLISTTCRRMCSTFSCP